MTHVMNLIATRHTQLEDENLRLTEELKVALELLVVIDTKREGLLRMAQYFREHWAPNGPDAEAEMTWKTDDEAFQQALIRPIATLRRDDAYQQRRTSEITRRVKAEADVVVKRHEARHQQMLADKWARKDALANSQKT